MHRHLWWRRAAPRPWRDDARPAWRRCVSSAVTAAIVPQRTLPNRLRCGRVGLLERVHRDVCQRNAGAPAQRQQRGAARWRRVPSNSTVSRLFRATVPGGLCPVSMERLEHVPCHVRRQHTRPNAECPSAGRAWRPRLHCKRHASDAGLWRAGVSRGLRNDGLGRLAGVQHVLWRRSANARTLGGDASRAWWRCVPEPRGATVMQNRALPRGLQRYRLEHLVPLLADMRCDGNTGTLSLHRRRWRLWRRGMPAQT